MLILYFSNSLKLIYKKNSIFNLFKFKIVKRKTKIDFTYSILRYYGK